MGQQNGTVWVNGEIREWSEAAVPLMSGAVLRAMAVFDGMIAIDRSGQTCLVGGRKHIQRLADSARSMGIGAAWDHEQVLVACVETARVEMRDTGCKYVYVRPMALGAELPGASNGTSLTIACFGQNEPTSSPDPIRMLTSPWRRPTSGAMSPSVKSVANYQLSRLAREQARSAGCDDAVVLNDSGRVSETAGAAIVVERDGALVSPPVWEDCLPSVTIEILENMAERIGVEFSRRPIPLADLHSATAVSTAGTLSDLIPISRIDHVTYGEGQALSALRHAYIDSLLAGSDQLEEWSISS